jgi:hypothetical protein
MPGDNGSGWESYQRYVIEELKRINNAVGVITDKIEKFRQEDIAQLKTDIALLKFQAAMYGAAAGIVFGGVATALVSMIFKMK